jgi:hypothetical protein
MEAVGAEHLLKVERERVIGDLQPDVVDADAEGDEARPRTQRTRQLLVDQISGGWCDTGVPI